MSTRGIIYKVDPTTGNYIGRYHHSDSYPEGLGKSLWDAYHGFFDKNINSMTSYLIDDHPSGWSTVVEVDFFQSPGYTDGFSRDGGCDPPACYCHGDRQEKEWTFSKKDIHEHDYSYALSQEGMDVFHQNKSVKVKWDEDEPDWEDLFGE